MASEANLEVTLASDRATLSAAQVVKVRATAMAVRARATATAVKARATAMAVQATKEVPTTRYFISSRPCLFDLKSFTDGQYPLARFHHNEC